MLSVSLGFVAAVTLCFAMTGVVLRLATIYKVLDHPGSRSLHSTVKPRGGGVAILLTVLILSPFWLMVYDVLPSTPMLMWAGTTLGISLLGLFDDLFSLSALIRLIGQLLLAAVCWAFIVQPQDLAAIGVTVVSVFIYVWVVNASNFVDGADGFLTSQAAVVFMASGVILLGSDVSWLGLISFASSGACVGFLIWNWQPAKIFLGDVGSYFIGSQLAAIVLFALHKSDEPFSVLIILIPIVLDPTLTFMWRVLSKKALMSPHRDHLYQLLILTGYSHAKTTVLYLLLTAGLFLPLALMASRTPSLAVYVLFCAGTVSSVFWVFCHKFLRKKLKTQS